MWRDFWTAQPTQVPTVSLVLQAVMLASLFGLALLVIRLPQSVWLKRLGQLAQIIQLISLYSWYLVFNFPLSESLPLYHCRLAMFGLLFLKDDRSIKRYLALIGVFGTLCAFIYPVLDPYDFPHLTTFSFWVGHLALWVNSLLYLFGKRAAGALSGQTLLLWTAGVNLVLVGVNQATGGNYGFLNDTPFITGAPLGLRYLAVTLALSLGLYAVEVLVANIQKIKT